MVRTASPRRRAHGSTVMAAVAVGAVAAASQGLSGTVGSAAVSGSTPLAFGGPDGFASFNGMGGNAPALGVLPLPDVVSVPRENNSTDVIGLGKRAHLAEQRTAERAAAARRAAPSGALGAARAAGRVVAPVTGRVTSNFGPRWGTIHYGLDIANRIGTPVLATTDGEVIDSGPVSGFGLWVRLRHDDGTVSVYGHINETLVSVGQRVAAGEQIATVGNRGQSTGPHLHFEVLLGGEERTDPLEWLLGNGVDI